MHCALESRRRHVKGEGKKLSTGRRSYNAWKKKSSAMDSISNEERGISVLYTGGYRYGVHAKGFGCEMGLGWLREAWQAAINSAG